MPTEPARRPLSALPSVTARVMAFAAIVVAGAAGALIGYGFMGLSGSGRTGSAIGGLVGAVFASAGVAVVAVLTLRAMGEWKQLGDDDGS
jgi:hypothetical protein